MDTVGHLTVAFPLIAAGDEAHVPAMDLMQIRIAALREGTQQVEGRGRLGIAFQHPGGIGHTGFFGEVEAVDDIAAVAWQFDAIHRFRV